MKETKEKFCSRKDHRQHTPGAPRAREWDYYMGKVLQEANALNNRLPYCGKMDQAWTVMLYKQKLIPRKTAVKLFSALEDAKHETGWGGEDWLKIKLNGDEDTASAVNYGRTLQEPMSRMQMRDGILTVFDEAFPALADILKKAEAHADTMMAGQSHFSHAQPTTYGAYLLAVHDGLSRGLQQLSLAYQLSNQNSGGCGACSGTGWPVDRELITELLGFDETIELSYDCEGSQDEIPTIMFALSSLAITLSRTAMDHGIWGLEEIGAIRSAPEWLGVSSFMPQKAHTPGMFENTRIACDEVIGEMMKVVTTFKGEAIQDVLPVYKSPRYVFQAIGYIRQALGFFRHLVKTLMINCDRMKEIVRNGYSGAPDLAIKMIREHGYGGRQAHRICCNFVRLARERNIKPYEMTGILLDEAAGITSEPPPCLSDEDIQDAMGLESFFEKHNNPGDPNPLETLRLIKKRRTKLKQWKKEQEARKKQLRNADQKLQKEINKIVNEKSNK